MFFKGSKTRRRKNKKRLRLVVVVPIYLYLRLRLRLVRPQGQALGHVGVDVLDGHVDVGVDVHPKPFFLTLRKRVLFVFFSQLTKEKIFVLYLWYQEYT